MRKEKHNELACICSCMLLMATAFSCGEVTSKAKGIDSISLLTPAEAPAPVVIDLGIADYSSGTKGPFARNPWDMTYFQGRLYIGQGNSDNDGSTDLNAGPMKIVSYNIAGSGLAGFRNEGYSSQTSLPEEQIDVIRLIDDALYIPGHDPRLDWTIRTTYKRTASDDQWVQYQSTNTNEGTSWGIHQYDLVKFGSELISCGYAYGVSNNGGQTWTDAGSSLRCSSLFAVKGRLFSATHMPMIWLDEYNPTTHRFFSRNDLSQQNMSRFLPGIQITDLTHTDLKIVRPVTVGLYSVYLAGYSTSDHQTGTVDVFLARSLDPGATDVLKTTPIDERPWDLLVRDSVVYLLTSRKTASGANEAFTVSIWKNNADYSGWNKLLSVPHLRTFARSFEEVKGDFYLGLGTDDDVSGYDVSDVTYTSELKSDSGRILRVILPSTALLEK